MCNSVLQEHTLTVAIVVLAPNRARECAGSIAQPWPDLLEQFGSTSVTFVMPSLPFECQSWDRTVESVRRALTGTQSIASLVLVPCFSDSTEECHPAQQLSSIASIVNTSIAVLFPWSLLRSIQPVGAAPHYLRDGVMSQLHHVLPAMSEREVFCVGAHRVVKLPPPSSPSNSHTTGCTLQPFPGLQTDQISIFPTFALRTASVALAAAPELCARIAAADNAERLTLALLADHLYGVALLVHARGGDCSSGLPGWAVPSRHGDDGADPAVHDLQLPPFEESLLIYYL
jgi:hypothetical protein